MFNEQAPPDMSTDVSVLVKDLMRRVRVLEERYQGLRKNIQVNEQNMIQIDKKLMTETRTINSEFVELKRTMFEMKSDITRIIKELKICASKEDVQVIEKYLKLWQPVKFVTRNEMEKYVAEHKKK